MCGARRICVLLIHLQLANLLHSSVASWQSMPCALGFLCMLQNEGCLGQVRTGGFMHSQRLMQAGVVYSGADDSYFKGWDVRDPSTPTFSLRKAHGAGVCCIQSNPHRDTEVATGSYDECARLWDVRMLCSPMMTCKVLPTWHGCLVLGTCMLRMRRRHGCLAITLHQHEVC